MAQGAKTNSRNPQGEEKFNGNPSPGAIIGAVAGATLGLAYGTIPKITKLDIGPIPGAVVGLVFGAAFGVILGGLLSTMGRAAISLKAGLGFVIAFILMMIMRLADDTGGPVDKIMDMIVAGTFWGVIGAIIAASGILDSSLSSADTASASREQAERKE